MEIVFAGTSDLALDRNAADTKQIIVSVNIAADATVDIDSERLPKATALSTAERPQLSWKAALAYRSPQEVVDHVTVDAAKGSILRVPGD